MTQTTTKQDYEQRLKYVTNAYGGLVGKTIHKVRPLTVEELYELAWEYDHDMACVIIFTDGTAFIPMADPEGNGAGFLFLTELEGK